MGGGFLVAAIVAAGYRIKTVRAKSEFLGSLRREWHADRALLDRILTAEEE